MVINNSNKIIIISAAAAERGRALQRTHLGFLGSLRANPSLITLPRFQTHPLFLSHLESRPSPSLAKHLLQEFNVQPTQIVTNLFCSTILVSSSLVIYKWSLVGFRQFGICCFHGASGSLVFLPFRYVFILYLFLNFPALKFQSLLYFSHPGFSLDVLLCGELMMWVGFQLDLWFRFLCI